MTKKQIFFTLTLGVLGLIVWIVTAKLSNSVEAWDNNYYFLVGLPIMCIASAVVGYSEPKYPFIWGVAVVVLQPVILIIHNGIDPLLFAGIVFFAFFMLLTVGSAYIGSAIRIRKS